MITTEVARKGYLEALLFLILWAAGLGLQESKLEDKVNLEDKLFSASK